jgi:hypothetical protein
VAAILESSSAEGLQTPPYPRRVGVVARRRYLHPGRLLSGRAGHWIFAWRLRRACQVTNRTRDRGVALKPRLVERFESCYDAILAEGFAFHETQPSLAPATTQGGRKHRGRTPRRTGHNLLLRKGRPRPRAAGRALAVVGAMFGDDGRLRLGQVEHLTGAVARGHGRHQHRTALRASLRVMIDDDVGLRDLPQGLSFMTFLSAGLVAGGLAHRHARRFLQPVTRRRLAAVGTVQSKPALEFGNMSPQYRAVLDGLIGPYRWHG